MSLVTSTKELLKAIGIWKLALVGVALIAMLAAVRFFPVLEWIKAFGQWSAQLGFAGALIYGIVFGIAAIIARSATPTSASFQGPIAFSSSLMDVMHVTLADYYGSRLRFGGIRRLAARLTPHAKRG